MKGYSERLEHCDSDEIDNFCENRESTYSDPYLFFEVCHYDCRRGYKL